MVTEEKLIRIAGINKYMKIREYELAPSTGEATAREREERKRRQLEELSNSSLPRGLINERRERIEHFDGQYELDDRAYPILTEEERERDREIGLERARAREQKERREAREGIIKRETEIKGKVSRFKELKCKWGLNFQYPLFKGKEEALVEELTRQGIDTHEFTDDRVKAFPPFQVTFSNQFRKDPAEGLLATLRGVQLKTGLSEFDYVTSEGVSTYESIIFRSGDKLIKVVPRWKLFGDHLFLNQEPRALKELAEVAGVPQLHSGIEPLGLDESFTFTEEGDAEIYVSQFLSDSQTFEDSLKYERFSLKDSVDATLGLLSILEEVHGKEWIHRDISPRNILIRDGKTNLIDFGLATQSENAGLIKTADDMMMIGTQGYSAPEQAIKFYNFLKAGPKLINPFGNPRCADTYAVGNILMNAMYSDLENPFAINNRENSEGREIRLRGATKKQREKLERIADRATSLQPTERYQSARLMQQDLGGVFR